MAFNVQLYHFAKRQNSTKRPDSNSGNGQDAIYTGTLKEGSTILTPSIAFKFDQGFSPRSLNYAHIPTFDRYYFITDWEYREGLWYANMQVDALATWKLYIDQDTEYVLRSAAQSDGNIMDIYYPTKAVPQIIRTTAETGWVNDMSQGYFVLGIINRDGNALSGISYYVLDQAAMNAFKSALLGSSTWLYDGITEISEELTRALVNPYQYVASCMWFPVEPPTWYHSAGLRIGWWNLNDVPVDGVGKTPTKIFNGSISIPKHPQAATRGVYLNSSPYSAYYLDFRPFGYIALDAQKLSTTSTLYWQYQLDFINGAATLRLATKADYTDSILVCSAMVGVPIQLAQISTDYLGVAENAIGAYGGAVGAVLSGITMDFSGLVNGFQSSVSSIGNAIRAAAPQASTSGSNGSFAGLSKAMELIGTFQILVDESNESNGRPLCQTKNLGTLNGYVVCNDPQIELPSTPQELQAVRQYMVGGMYLE